MRLPRALLLPLLALALGAIGLAPGLAGAAQGRSPRASAWFAEADPGAVNGTYVPIVGDFSSANPYDDIIWYAPGAGKEQVWVNNGNHTFAKQQLQSQVNGTYTPIVGEFSGDELDDIFWYGPGGANDVFWKAIGSHTFQSYAAPISGTYTPYVIPDSAGKDDILWLKAGGTGSSIWSFTGTGAGHISTPLNAPAGSQPLVGNYNGDEYGDIFWYGPGTAADALWVGDDGIGSFSITPQTVNGTFTPIVADFTPNESAGAAPGTGPKLIDTSIGKDDILWYRSPGTSVLWEGHAPLPFVSSPHTIAIKGTPLTGSYSWGYVYFWNTTQPDQVWYDNAAGADYYQEAGNTELGAGYTPLLGNWDGYDGIFWYKPGSAPERLFGSYIS